MRALFYSFLGYFLTPAGLVLMAALDSSMVFFLPLGIDFVVIMLAAQEARVVLALRDPRDDRIADRRRAHLLDRTKGRRARPAGSSSRRG